MTVNKETPYVAKPAEQWERELAAAYEQGRSEERAAVLKEADDACDALQDACDQGDEYGCNYCVGIGEVRDWLDEQRPLPSPRPERKP